VTDHGLVNDAIRQKMKQLPVIGPVLRRVHRVARSRFPMLFDRGASWSRGESRTHLCLGVEYVYSAEVEGDIAEFGTMSGETAVTIAVAMRECDRLLLRRPKRLYLFDSFEGLPAIASMADRESIHVKSGVWTAGGCKMLAKDELIGRLCRKISPERLVVYDGWYKDTVLTLPSGTRFAMLHVDCDLYQSTMDALEPLFSKGHLAEGALILFDDWYCNRASPSYGEQRAWSELVGRFSIAFSDVGSYGWGGRKFIVHAYQARR